MSESEDDEDESLESTSTHDLSGGLALADLTEWSPYAAWTYESVLWSRTDLSSQTLVVSSAETKPRRAAIAIVYFII